MRTRSFRISPEIKDREVRYRVLDGVLVGGAVAKAGEFDRYDVKQRLLRGEAFLSHKPHQDSISFPHLTRIAVAGLTILGKKLRYLPE